MRQRSPSPSPHRKPVQQQQSQSRNQQGRNYQGSNFQDLNDHKPQYEDLTEEEAGNHVDVDSELDDDSDHNDSGSDNEDFIRSRMNNGDDDDGDGDDNDNDQEYGNDDGNEEEEEEEEEGNLDSEWKIDREIDADWLLRNLKTVSSQRVETLLEHLHNMDVLTVGSLVMMGSHEEMRDAMEQEGVKPVHILAIQKFSDRFLVSEFGEEHIGSLSPSKYPKRRSATAGPREIGSTDTNDRNRNRNRDGNRDGNRIHQKRNESRGNAAKQTRQKPRSVIWAVVRLLLCLSVPLFLLNEYPMVTFGPAHSGRRAGRLSMAPTSVAIAFLELPFIKQQSPSLLYSGVKSGLKFYVEKRNQLLSYIDRHGPEVVRPFIQFVAPVDMSTKDFDTRLEEHKMLVKQLSNPYEGKDTKHVHVSFLIAIWMASLGLLFFGFVLPVYPARFVLGQLYLNYIVFMVCTSFITVHDYEEGALVFGGLLATLTFMLRRD